MKLTRPVDDCEDLGATTKGLRPEPGRTAVKKSLEIGWLEMRSHLLQRLKPPGKSRIKVQA